MYLSHSDATYGVHPHGVAPAHGDGIDVREAVRAGPGLVLALAATMRLAIALALLVGCGSSPSSTTATPEPLVFERYSPPQFTSRDVFVAAEGDVIVLANRLSADGGASWQPSPFGAVERAAIHGSVIATYAGGLVRYDTATRAMTPVTGAPSYAGPRTWRTTPAGALVVFAPITNAIAFETATGWITATLPQHSPTEVDPYITDVEHNGTTTMVVSAWGVYRSVGDAFEPVLPQSSAHGRELVALADGRFVLLGGTTTLRFDASGTVAGESAGTSVDTGDAIACDDGALVARGKISRDAAASWQPLLGGGDLTLTIERVGCGGGRYWVLGHNNAWGYRLLRYDDPAAPGVAVGNWELAGDPAWRDDGPPIVRTADGTFISAGLAWREGDAAWTLRLVPAKTWAAGNTLFGAADGQFFTSDDAGRTWRAVTTADLPAEVEAFARAPDGALHVSRFVGESTATHDAWHATVWRSSDSGTTWSTAYDATATRLHGENTAGEVHRFVGITAAGAWIATDAISNDGGATWQPTEFEGDKHLAFLTPDGFLVTPRDDVWRVYEAGGLGELRGTWELEAEGQPVPASQLRSVAFDELGHAYVARGAPYVQIWRSTQPIMERRASPR